MKSSIRSYIDCTNHNAITQSELQPILSGRIPSKMYFEHCNIFLVILLNHNITGAQDKTSNWIFFNL